MTIQTPLVRFPLYHGSSSLHLENFIPGEAPRPFEHHDAAIRLFREAWAALADLGRSPEWWIQRMLEQSSQHSNWRHGTLYVSPSTLSAVRYASSGARCGGELLTMCADALASLRGLVGVRAQQLEDAFSELGRFLKGVGEPILVELGELTAGDLTTKVEGKDVSQMLQLLDGDEKRRHVIGQQVNFAVQPNCGVVLRVSRLEVERPGDPLTLFRVIPILDQERSPAAK